MRSQSHHLGRLGIYWRSAISSGSPKKGRVGPFGHTFKQDKGLPSFYQPSKIHSSVRSDWPMLSAFRGNICIALPPEVFFGDHLCWGYPPSLPLPMWSGNREAPRSHPGTEGEAARQRRGRDRDAERPGPDPAGPPPGVSWGRLEAGSPRGGWRGVAGRADPVPAGSLPGADSSPGRQGDAPGGSPAPRWGL